jgi:hypothetical protein
MDNGTSDLLKTQAAGQHFFCIFMSEANEYTRNCRRQFRSIGRAAVILKAMVERAKALGMKPYSRWKNG